MLSYMSLLVLVLATSAVSPVRTAEPLEIEGTSHSEPSEKPRFKVTTGKVLVALGALAFVGLIVTNLVGGPPPPSHSNKNNPISTTQPNPTTQPTATPSTSPPQPTPTTPPRAFAGREVRILDRRHGGLSVDTSGEPYPKSYLDGVADSVVTTVGHSETRSISDNNNQKMHTPLPLDLLSRADFGKALSLFNRMLDELD